MIKSLFIIKNKLRIYISAILLILNVIIMWMVLNIIRPTGTIFTTSYHLSIYDSPEIDLQRRPRFSEYLQ